MLLCYPERSSPDLSDLSSIRSVADGDDLCDSKTEKTASRRLDTCGNLIGESIVKLGRGETVLGRPLSAILSRLLTSNLSTSGSSIDVKRG